MAFNFHSIKNNYKFVFERVTVILGANGAGKTKLLSEIRDHCNTAVGMKPIFIEGGRTIKIKDILQMDHSNYNQFDRLESALANYETKRAYSLADRLFDALMILEKKEAYVKSAHSDEVENWKNNGMHGNCPSRPQAPMAKLFELFSEIFPKIKITLNSTTKQFSVLKNDQTYHPSSLSDGEKQVFSILADMIDLDSAYGAIIADEPELNLHPELAERLWTLIENEFPEKIFIYATHNINFSLRENVEKVYILSSESENISELTDIGNIPRVEMNAFLGGLPGILSASKVMVTEGHEKSFDAIFYRWLMEDDKLEIFPIGGCTDVISVVNKSGLWGKISTHVSLFGAIDSDYRDDAYLESLKNEGVSCLPLHEAESYLCVPEIIFAVAKNIGSQENELALKDIESIIIDALERQKLAIAVRRFSAKSKLNIGVSIERKALNKLINKDDIINELKNAAQNEINKVHASIGSDQIKSEYENQLNEIENIIKNKDIHKALKLLPGKELLNQISPKAGCKNGTDLMRSLRKNFKPDEFEETKKLKNLIKFNK